MLLYSCIHHIIDQLKCRKQIKCHSSAIRDPPFEDKLFNLTEGRKLNTKVSLHHPPTANLPTTQTFRALPNDLGNLHFGCNLNNLPTFQIICFPQIK